MKPIDRNALNIGDTICYPVPYRYGWNCIFRHKSYLSGKITKMTPKRTKITLDNNIVLDKDTEIYYPTTETDYASLIVRKLRHIVDGIDALCDILRRHDIFTNISDNAILALDNIIPTVTALCEAKLPKTFDVVLIEKPGEMGLSPCEIAQMTPFLTNHEDGFFPLEIMATDVESSAMGFISSEASMYLATNCYEYILKEFIASILNDMDKESEDHTYILDVYGKDIRILLTRNIVDHLV